VGRDNAGYSVADAGDVNKDGYQDVLIGAINADSGSKADAGAVYLVFGSPSRSTSTIDTASTLSPKGIKISGAAGYDHWGNAVSGTGDVNKDGIEDFIIGAFAYDPPSRTDAGGAVVIFGKTSGWVDIDLASFTSGSAGFWIWGAYAGDGCGNSLSGAGDVNGDGTADIVIGAPFANSLSRIDSGAAYVIFGHSNGAAFSTVDLASFTPGSSGFTLFGAVINIWAGVSVNGAGDVNGDGYDDIIVGAKCFGPSTRTASGAAYVIFGHSSVAAFTDIDLAALNSSQGFRITGAGEWHNLGVSVSSAGDFNNDGYDDVVVGTAINRAYVFLGHSNSSAFPAVDTVVFAAGSAGFTVTGSNGFGSTVSGGADINRDGVDDIIIAAPSYANTGAAFVLYGRSQLLFTDIVLSWLSGVSGYRINGAAAASAGSWSVSLMRDFDGDGVGEVLVGAPNADPLNRDGAGAVFLVYGELSAPTSQPSRQPTGQPSRQPSSRPTSQPTRQPTSLPTAKPSRQPSSRPTSQPSRQPTTQPSAQPSMQPTGRPSGQPTLQPSGQPTLAPTRQPSSQPSRQPSSVPSRQPTAKPSWQPSSQPSTAFLATHYAALSAALSAAIAVPHHAAVDMS
jgi:hypothetical protein